MKKIALFFFTLVLGFSCKKFENNQSIQADITDLQGVKISEASSGQMVKLSSEEFGNPSPNGNLPSSLKVFFDNTQAPIQSAGQGYIIVAVPVMYLADYKTLVISVRIGSIKLNLIQNILYRPTVRGRVIAGGPASTSFEKPAELTVDPSGNVYVIDQRTNNDVIIKVTPAGTTSVFAGGANEFGRLTGIGINPSGTELYVADATAQQLKKIPLASSTAITVLAGSGTVGNTDGSGISASFSFGNEPVSNASSNEKGQGLTVDASGNIYVGERVGTSSSVMQTQVRRITPAGVVTTVAGSTKVPMAFEDISTIAGLTSNTAGEIFYVGGGSTMFQGISKVTPAGPTRFAGKISFEGMNDGTGPVAEFSYPKSIRFHGFYFYIADGWNGALRKAGETGDVITLAGIGHFNTPSFCGCGITVPKDSSYVMPSLFNVDPNRFEVTAKAIIMDLVGGVAVQNPGLIYISDYGFKCLWRITIE